MGAHSGFQVWVPRSLIEVHAHTGAFGLCPGAAEPLIRVCAHSGFQLWAPRPLIEVHTHLGFQLLAPHQGFRCGRPAGVSVVGPQSAGLGVRQVGFSDAVSLIS